MGTTWYLDISVFCWHFKFFSVYSYSISEHYVPSVPLQSNDFGFDDDSIPVQLKSLRKDFPSWRVFPETWLISLLPCLYSVIGVTVPSETSVIYIYIYFFFLTLLIHSGYVRESILFSIVLIMYSVCSQHHFSYHSCSFL